MKNNYIFQKKRVTFFFYIFVNSLNILLNRSQMDSLCATAFMIFNIKYFFCIFFFFFFGHARGIHKFLDLSIYYLTWYTTSYSSSNAKSLTTRSPGNSILSITCTGISSIPVHATLYLSIMSTQLWHCWSSIWVLEKSQVHQITFL